MIDPSKLIEHANAEAEAEARKMADLVAAEEAKTYVVEEDVVCALLKTKTQLSVINGLRAGGDSPERAKLRVEASLVEAKRR